MRQVTQGRLVRGARAVVGLGMLVGLTGCPSPTPGLDGGADVQNPSDVQTPSDVGMGADNVQMEGGTRDDCMTECRASSMNNNAQFCGTNRMTYAGCDWYCGATPAGVGVYPGACQADGSPPTDAPPYAADGDRVCDWFKQGASWVAVECLADFEGVDTLDMPVGMESQFDSQVMPAMPTEVDHRTWYGPIKNQGSAGTCTAFGTTALVEGAVRSQLGSSLQLSEMHLWGRYHTASTMAAAAAARRGGITTVTVADGAGFEYDAPRATRWENNEETVPANTLMDLDMMGQFEVASVDLLPTPPGARHVMAEQVQAALASGKDLVAAFSLGKQWFTPNTGADGIIPEYDLTNAKSGHAVALVGYRQISGKTYFIIRNSWGAGWADGGYGYISADTLNEAIRYAWSITVRPAGSVSVQDCASGQAAALDGTCRMVCADGSLADMSGSCMPAPADCGAGKISVYGSCVQACAMGDVTGEGYTATCTDRGCRYTIDDGAFGCMAGTGGTCEKFCPAPVCQLTTARNEFNVLTTSCR